MTDARETIGSAICKFGLKEVGTISDGWIATAIRTPSPTAMRMADTILAALSAAGFDYEAGRRAGLEEAIFIVEGFLRFANTGDDFDKSLIDAIRAAAPTTGGAT